MKIRSLAAAATIGAMILLAQGLAAEAAEVKVIAGTGMRAVWEELAPQFERATGHKLVVWYGISGTIKRRMAAGEAFDLFVSGRDGVDEYTKQGKIAAGTRTEIARVGMGVGVRAGAPKPDISSVDAFKRALLNAKSVTYEPEGVTGIHLARVFERLGIAEQMKAKTKPQKVTGRTAQVVAGGEAELGFGLTTSLLSVRGVELVGPFPPELQRYNLFTAGVATAAEQPEAAKALIKFLRSPAAVAVIKAKGMEPATS
ncbi:MAG: molybdate ABC transporter substrate-binding protein [Betaproteobacteria bacterium]|nr:molybdate ABC transporter substrate-binding protein [Betaproteobacteria bacterium]MBI3057404.1 molybdate ABC transporter substrate-binding protein [Betaproteobacteria bacterium]